MSGPAKQRPESRRRRGAWTLPVWAACLLTGCAGEQTEHRHSFPALGTLITIEIHHPDEDEATRAAAAVSQHLERIGHDWYAWGDGELGRINARLAGGEASEVSSELAAPIRRAIEIRRLSGGYFDPTVGLLVEAWGFNDSRNPPVRPPAEEWLAAWRASAAQRERLTLKDNVVSAPVPLKLALGGIAKGTTLAESTRLLQVNGIDHALVEAGGDLQVLGRKGGRKWRIGVRDPRSPGVLGVVELESGEAILSSGDYERYFELDGQRYHHLLDPHTGLPVNHTAGVTVIHADPELADAAATALMAAGPERFHALVEQLGIRFALLVRPDGELLATPAMRARLEM